ncbi:flavin reductase family protein [Thermodesulfobacteriota bacterium]
MNSKLDDQVFNYMSYGLYVLTSRDNGNLNGQIVNSVNQVTYDPVRVAVAINKKNLTHEYITKSKMFAVSVLDESTPMSFFQLFGFKSGRDIDKLSMVKYKEGVTGCPVVEENSLSIVEAVVFKEIDLGTHTIFIGNAIASEVFKIGNSLTYKYYRDDLNGKVPENAPNYNPIH